MPIPHQFDVLYDNQIETGVGAKMSTVTPDLLDSVGVSLTALTNKVEYIRVVREGLPGSVVKNAISLFGGRRDVFVRLLNTTPANLSRYYRKKSLSRVDTEEILDTLRLYSHAYSVFGDADITSEWLDSPIPALSGDRPFDLFDTFEGRNWVRETLRKIEFGEFS